MFTGMMLLPRVVVDPPPSTAWFQRVFGWACARGRCRLLEMRKLANVKLAASASDARSLIVVASFALTTAWLQGMTPRALWKRMCLLALSFAGFADAKMSVCDLLKVSAQPEHY
jgi:hypothetical protein